MGCKCVEIADSDMELSPTCIGQLWIFDRLSTQELDALVEDALRKKRIKGQALFMQGDPADEMFLIKGGRVKLTKVLEDGNELTLDIRKAGDFLGETMFSNEGEYPVSAYCLENTLTCGFTRSVLLTHISLWQHECLR
jgi:CRP/FNR family transcriptional regulator